MLKEATWAGHWVSVGSGRVREVSEVLEPPSEELQKLAGAPWWLGFAEGLLRFYLNIDDVSHGPFSPYILLFEYSTLTRVRLCN